MNRRKRAQAWLVEVNGFKRTEDRHAQRTLCSLHSGDGVGVGPAVMSDLQVKIKIDRWGHPPVLNTARTGAEVGFVLRGLEGEPDTTVTISRDGMDELLLVAVSGARAFLGLDGPEGVFQFAHRDNGRRGRQQLIIGGQESDIESRYVLCLEEAARVAEEWLKKGRESSFGVWEPR